MDQQMKIAYLIGRLPRKFRGDLNARVWSDDAGRVCIDLKGGGALLFTEHECVEFTNGGAPLYGPTWTVEAEL